MSRSIEWKRGYQSGYQAGWRRYAAETPIAIDREEVWPRYLRWATQFQVWTDERLDFIGREFTVGTPLEIIDQCALDMSGGEFTPDALDELIEARGWQRPPDWNEDAAWAEWHGGSDAKPPVNGGLGPFGVAGYQERTVWKAVA